MINNEQTGSLNATRSCCYGSQRRPLPPKSLRGVYYALRGGNHMMHFRQSHWKKLVRGAINCIIMVHTDASINANIQIEMYLHLLSDFLGDPTPFEVRNWMSFHFLYRIHLYIHVYLKSIHSENTTGVQYFFCPW